MIILLLSGGGIYLQKRKLQKAYGAIFIRNQEFLEADNENRELRRRLEEALGKCGSAADDVSEQTTEKDLATDGPTDKEDSIKRVHSVDKLSLAKKDSLLRQIRDVMENDSEIFDTEFSIERLAALTDSNSRYLSSVINERLATNFRGMLNEYRIKEAQRRLSDVENYGQVTIQAIANGVGFKSYANFVELFKRHTGITPSIYQKNARERYNKHTNS